LPAREHKTALLPPSGAQELSDRVPFLDLEGQYWEIREEVLAALDRVSAGAEFVLGEEVARFEEEFADYCAVRHCVALNSGTSALHLALLAAGVGAGDEVVTVANTFVATAAAISYTGARPVFADIRPATANIDPAAVEESITPRTRAIVPVHLYGRPADLAPILDLARRHDLAVIEDACQAHGARYRGRRVGSFGLAGAFSFYPSKNLGAYGEGGALTTNDAGVAEFARAARDHGQAQRDRSDAVGFNYRPDGFQGAVLRIKLKRLEEWNARRREHAGLYRELLDGTGIDSPEDDPRDESVYHLFAVYVGERDSARSVLEERGVGTGIHYPNPIHLQPAYEGLGYAPGAFPHAEHACERELSLPLFPEMTSDQVRRVASRLAEVCAAG
jgi:dTDP-4-amino-4,6-dideoxygalactose transaminase